MPELYESSLWQKQRYATSNYTPQMRNERTRRTRKQILFRESEIMPYADKEKQKAYMREYAKKRRELFKKWLNEKEISV